MTKFDFYGIINSGFLSKSDNGNIQIHMEVNADKLKELMVPHSKQDKACLKIEAMDELKVNIFDAASYLILLFYRTNASYTCTRTKIGKLLSIVAFSYAREDRKIFDEKIYKYNNCGTAIAEIMNSYDRDIYPRYTYQDGTVTITEQLKDFSELNEIVQKKYSNGLNLAPTVKTRIESVFRRFGAYKPEILGEYINCIINIGDVVNTNGEVDLEKIHTLDKSAIIKENKNNGLVQFLIN